jgi:hypothetical protein
MVRVKKARGKLAKDDPPTPRMPKRHYVLALLCDLSILAVVIARAASWIPSTWALSGCRCEKSADDPSNYRLQPSAARYVRRGG